MFTRPIVGRHAARYIEEMHRQCGLWRSDRCPDPLVLSVEPDTGELMAACRALLYPNDCEGS